MKLNARILFLAHMVYLSHKHSLLLVAFTQLYHIHVHRLTVLGYGAIPLFTPLASFLVSSLLTYLESLLLRGAIPSTLAKGCS
jgi:hypothetical protein